MRNDTALIGVSAREELVELAPAMRRRSADVAHLILQQIQLTIPAYSRPIEGTFGKAILHGVQQGVLEFLDRLLDPEAAGNGTADLFRHLGRYEVIEGRGIDVLQSAYRVGGRVGWQALSEFGLRMGLPVETMCELAAALFAYIDELSALSHEGYVAAQARAAGAQERRRKRLLELLLSDQRAPAAVLLEHAEAAAWTPPERVAVVVLEVDDGRTGHPELAEDVLVDLESDAPCLVVPAPGGEVPDLADSLRGWRCVLGPVVLLADARDSLRWARQLAGLIADGVVEGAPVVSCADHLLTLWLLSDRGLADQLVARAQAPLDGLNARQRERLAETLSAWLETRGGAPEIAGQLNVHPQTVRYRIHQLDELYGERLRDPDERFAIAVALRARRLRHTRPE
ncbi:PucR family transcriptional regulator [Prauserella cavernicola]|uniref:Helix-turn-helix domain-containing protein n=1 Tax=Prauserella cavernicola TaxID=2800127 RepID=A0A934QYW7_9PSEU|nr:PucR family transcriptional regulator [Prauserella cavernicola]MBK1788810.1 helix-turn-helix domain-containing protein [Prauserella cavernicola]